MSDNVKLISKINGVTKIVLASSNANMVMTDDGKTLEQKLNVINERMDTFTSLESGSTTGDAELIDARIGYDGFKYSSAGEAIRNQISDLSETIESIETGTNSGHSYDVSYENSILTLYEDGEIKSEVTIVSGSGGGGGGALNSKISISHLNGSSFTCIFGNSLDILYSYESLDSTGDSTGDGSAVWYVNNTRVVSESIHQGNNKFDVGKYLKSGDNTIRIQVTDPVGSIAIKTWTVNAVNMYIDISYIDDTKIQNDDYSIRIIPYGNIEKTIHISVDGNEIITDTTINSGKQMNYTIPAQTDGAHKLELYMDAVVNDIAITSNTYTKYIMWSSHGENTLISTTAESYETDQYNTIRVEYIVYNPNTQTATVEFYIDDQYVASQVVDRTRQIWAYKAITSGNHILKLVSNGTEKTISIKVNELAYDIHEITSGKVCDFNPALFASNDDLKSWKYNDITITFSNNFDWINGGIKVDSDDSQYFCVKQGTRATINFNLFADDARRIGKNFKFIYKITNANDYNATAISCLSNNIGFTIGAQSALMRSEQTSIESPLCEDDYTELSYNIIRDTLYREMVAWEDGVPSRFAIYADNDNFVQQTPVPITIGSDDCDVWIYRFKSYNTNLSDGETNNNFIADAPNATEMVNRYVRNNVTNDDGEIDYNKVSQVLPEVRVILLECPTFTTGKKNKVSGCTVRHIYTAGGLKHCWTSENAIHNGQGTSSEYYGDSARNLDFNCSGGFQFDDGTLSAMYAMTDTSVPTNYFNLKVNVASSENANNPILQAEYNDFQPYKRAIRQENNNVRDTMEFHPMALFIKDKSGALFGDDNYHFYAAGDFGNSKKTPYVQGYDEDNEQECVIEFDINTTDQCRFKSADLSNETWDGNGSFEGRYPDELSISQKDSWQMFCEWVVSTATELATDKALPSPVTYQNAVLSYPDGSTTEYKTITFDKDTAEYRRVKFVKELKDHAIVDSCLFHYLFTERHTMVDNRAKNVFAHTSDGIYWDFTQDYDNDTADGNDNEGNLSLSYGMEDTDTIGTKSVFNASDSTLWCNIRDLMHNDLKAMFLQLENEGAWDAKRIIERFNTYQNAKSERLITADMRRKYFRPFEDYGTTSYIPMMYGKKVHQRRQFEIYQEKYMASKYLTPVATSNAITLRGYTPLEYAGVTPKSLIEITPYSDMYVALKAGSITRRVRCKKDISTSIDFSDVGILNDTEIYIYSATNIKAIGSLAQLYVGYSNFTYATKLETIEIGSDAEGYTNTNMTEFGIGNNIKLKKLNLQNCPNLKQALSVSGCTQLEEFYANGSGLTGVSFAPGGYLRVAHLPGVVSLKLENLELLTELTLDSMDNIVAIQYNDCPNINIENLIENSTNLDRIRLIGVDFTYNDVTSIDKLLTLRGIDENQYVVDTPVITGKFTVNQNMNRSSIVYYTGVLPEVEFVTPKITEDMLESSDHYFILDSDGNSICMTNGYVSIHDISTITDAIKM